MLWHRLFVFYIASQGMVLVRDFSRILIFINNAKICSKHLYIHWNYQEKFLSTQTC